MIKLKLFKFSGAIAAILLSFAAVIPVMTAHMSPGIVYVDDNCVLPSDGTFGDPFCTVQDGVNHAVALDTVQVAVGNYPEDVTVNKRLTVLGARANTDALTRTGPESVVRSFNLTADRIIVQGFTVAGNTAGPGVSTSASNSGYQILRNIIRDNVFGVAFKTNGTVHSVMGRNLVKDNNSPGFPTGNGVYTNQLNNASVERNKFTGQANYSVNFETPLNGTPNSGIDISRNEAVGEKNMIYVYNINGGTISRNTATGFVAGGTGIQLDGDNNNVLIERNIIIGATIDGILVRDLGYGSNTGIRIERNTTSSNGRHGISLNNATATQGGFAIERNTANNNVVGDGINITFGNNGGSVLRNNMINNITHHDAHDDSIGTGTAGTANHWDRNNCDTDSPDGLCE